MSAEMTETTGVGNQMGTFFPWWLLLIQGIIALILGSFLITYPIRTLSVIIWFLGFYWFFSGIVTLFTAFVDSRDRGWKILLGIIGIILGLLILAYPLYSTFVVPFVFTIMVGVIRPDLRVHCLYGGFTGKGWGVGILGLLSIILRAPYPRKPLCFHACSPLRLRDIRYRLWICGHCRFILPQVSTKGLNIFSVFSVAATVKRDCNEPFDRSRSLFEEKKRGRTHVPRRHDASKDRQRCRRRWKIIIRRLRNDEYCAWWDK